MNEPKRIPPDKVDELAARLQTSLKRRRPRNWPAVLGALLVAILVLGLLAWWLYPGPAPPRLEVIAFDAVAAPDESPSARAQLAFPDDGEYPPTLLRGHNIVFLDAMSALLPGQAGVEQSTTSDAKGRAAVPWPLPAPGKPSDFLVRYVDVRRKQGSSDEAKLFLWARGDKVLLVSVEETLVQGDLGPADGARPADVQPQAAQVLAEAAQKGYRIGYLAVTPTTDLRYRKVRGWVRQQQRGADGLPAGPVLGRKEYPATDATQARVEVLADVKARFGDAVTLVGRGPAAGTDGTAVGVRLIVVGGEPVPGAVRAADWSGVPTLLHP
jgi:hypothetical protein